MGVRVNEWINGWVDGWVHGWVDHYYLLTMVSEIDHFLSIRKS